MKSPLIFLGLFVALAFGQTLTINTPANVVECEPTLLTWSGGTPPYFLSILPGNQPGAQALQNLGQQSGTSLTWPTNIAAGTSIGLTIRDSIGTTASSAPFTINAGSSSSCLTSSAGSTSAASTPAGSASGASSSIPAASSTPATTSSPSTTSTPSATKPTTTATTPAASTASSGTGTKTASGGSSTGGASVNTANLGVAGIIGAVVMAILA